MSAYRTIVVHLDDAGKHRAERLDVAFGLAASFDAHLVGLYAPGLADVPSAAIAEAGAIEGRLGARRTRQAAAKAEREFRAAAKRCAMDKTEWRASKDDALCALRLSGRYADLIVLGQQDPDSREPYEPLSSFAGDVVLAAGRPVLFVPYAGHFPAIGGRVLVAWNASREATRAVSDALPLLERAQHVEIVAFDPERGSDHGEVRSADIALYLSRHGVKAIAAEQGGTSIEIGAQILSRAADIGADLIVMGGYGHSPFRERVLGGATRTLLESMTVPVLMSH
jgi:nucleotide-binding universal stress UspA family protein